MRDQGGEKERPGKKEGITVPFLKNRTSFA